MNRKIFAVLSFLLLGCLLSAYASNADFEPVSYVYGTDEVSAVSIDVRDREISISPSADGMIHIDGYAGSTEFYSTSSVSGKKLEIELTYDKGWKDFFGGKTDEEYRKLIIQVPSDLASLKVSTTNEDINADSVSLGGELSLYSNGGDINVNSADAERRIVLETKNGDISGSVAGSWDDYSISVEIKKGDSNLSDKSGGVKELSVKANNGDINISILE